MGIGLSTAPMVGFIVSHDSPEIWSHARTDLQVVAGLLIGLKQQAYKPHLEPGLMWGPACKRWQQARMVQQRSDQGRNGLQVVATCSNGSTEI